MKKFIVVQLIDIQRNKADNKPLLMCPLRRDLKTRAVFTDYAHAQSYSDLFGQAYVILQEDFSIWEDRSSLLLKTGLAFYESLRAPHGVSHHMKFQYLK